MVKAERPFLIVNPKSYLYGQKSLELAKAADETAAMYLSVVQAQAESFREAEVEEKAS